MQLTVVLLSVLSLHLVFTGCQGKTILTDDIVLLTDDIVLDKDNEDAVVELLQLLTSVQDVQAPDTGIHGDQEAVSLDVLKEILAEITEDVELDLIKGCSHGRCEFCTSTKWFKLCVEASILNLGFEVTVSLNGRTIYHKEISVRNPPPICFNTIPGLSYLADVCLMVYDVDLVNKKACVKITFKIKFIKKGISIKLGCFKIPFASLPETDQASDNSRGALTFNGSPSWNPYV